MIKTHLFRPLQRMRLVLPTFVLALSSASVNCTDDRLSLGGRLAQGSSGQRSNAGAPASGSAPAIDSNQAAGDVGSRDEPNGQGGANHAGASAVAGTPGGLDPEPGAAGSAGQLGRSSGAAGASQTSEAGGGSGGVSAGGGGGSAATSSGAAGGGSSAGGSSAGGASAGSAGIVPPSCRNLAKTCGSTQNDDCCASPLIPGGTFNRYNLAQYPATVSSFRLDKYEVTVGRFRKFLAALRPQMIANGAGKNPNNPNDPGWDATHFDSHLAADESAFFAAQEKFYSNATSRIAHTMTTQPASDWHENLPMNNVDWWHALAFCIWDGGRLPTVAEGSYAQSGGSEQRSFPWGNTPEASVEYANFSCLHADGPRNCNLVGAIWPVGTAPLGDGRWGQADLLGNMLEWVQDNWPNTNTFPLPCNDCAFIVQDPKSSHGMDRGLMGGSYGYSTLKNPALAISSPGLRASDAGLRCARPAP